MYVARCKIEFHLNVAYADYPMTLLDYFYCFSTFYSCITQSECLNLQVVPAFPNVWKKKAFEAGSTPLSNSHSATERNE